jgi:tight adherence protein C
MAWMEILILLLAFAAIALFIVGVAAYLDYEKERRRLSQRIKEMSEGVRSREGPDHFYRIYQVKDQLVRMVGSLGNLVKPRSEGELSHLRKAFLKAGYRRENAWVIFLGIKVFLAIGFLGVLSLIRLWFFKSMTSLHFAVLSVIFLGMGFYLPNLWLQVVITRRKQRIQEGLPDALDLMVVCVEAGTGLDAAISRVGEEMKLSNSVLSEEFKLLSLELKAGKQRRDALRNLALRTDLEDLSSLVTLLIQTDKFGTSVAQALRVHSDSMRTKRYQKAEELATKLPVKLVFPLILFIFPSIFVTILGPAIIQIFRILLPRLAGQ